MKLTQPPLAVRAVASALLVGVFATACATAPTSSETSLVLVGYSTPREAYAQLIQAFQATPEGAGVTFDESYGASTEQATAVRNGLQADIVALAFEPDMTSLVDDGLVSANWNATPSHGMVTDSVVALVVRKGNPRHIADWSDLLQPGVEVVTPNPFTSGGAQWDIVAGYGAQLRASKSPAQAAEYLRSLFAHVPVQGKSGREALQAFVGGKGDVLISYENEAILAQQQGEAIDYVIPDNTILIENPIAVTANSAHPAQAQAFVNFLLSPTGQHIFGAAGYRPVDPEVAGQFAYPQPSGLFSINELGGWPTVEAQLFARQSGLVGSIFASQGIASNGD